MKLKIKKNKIILIMAIILIIGSSILVQKVNAVNMPSFSGTLIIDGNEYTTNR